MSPLPDVNRHFKTNVMKLLIIILSIPLIAYSCNKEKIDPVQPPMSVTLLHHYYDTDNKYLKTDTSWHSCSVWDEELKVFQNQPKIQSLCQDDNKDRQEIVIQKVCPVNNCGKPINSAL